MCVVCCRLDVCAVLSVCCDCARSEFFCRAIDMEYKDVEPIDQSGALDLPMSRDLEEFIDRCAESNQVKERKSRRKRNK